MPGIFGTNAPLAADLSLLLQLIIFVILILGIRFGRKKTLDGLKTHGRIMTGTVALHTIGILLVMVPSLVMNFPALRNEPSTIGFPVTSIHVLLGVLAEGLGIVLIFRKLGNVRMWMRIEAMLWLIATIFGISFYLRYYVL